MLVVMNTVTCCAILLALLGAAFSEQAPLDPEILKGYQSLSLDLLAKTDFHQQTERNGVAAFCSFTMGYLLALVREDTFAVCTEGISQVLHFPEDKITQNYAALASSFLEDKLCEASSTLFTPVEDLTIPPGVTQLSTVKNQMTLYDNREAAATINNLIANSTHDVIVSRLIPRQKENYSPFYKSTQGVYANTFYYKNQFDTPLTDLGLRTFYANSTLEEQVQTLETTGFYPAVETDSYSAVSIPLKGGRKRLVFIQPKNCLHEFLNNNVSDIFKQIPTDWASKNVRVQIPAIRFILARSYDQQLSTLGVTHTFCQANVQPAHEKTAANFLQPLVQVISVSITPEDYTVAVNNGAQVNNLKAFVEEFPKSVAAPVTPTAKTEAEPFEKKESHGVRQLENTFVFDKPFFVYLHDNVLGATSFAAIRSTVPFTSYQDKARHHEEPQDFTQATIQHRYQC